MATTTFAPIETAPIHEQNNFDSTFWDNFISNTENFKETFVIPDALGEDDINQLTNMTLEVVRKMCIKKTDAYGFRVYIEGKRVDNTFMEQQVFENPPQPAEDVREWANRVFKDRKFGVILNSGEKFCQSLAQKLSLFIIPLLEKVGIPSSGLHSTIFIGNYGYTPLGIHQDHPGGSVIHFHLGPGGKVMYNWEANEYEKVKHLAKNNKDIEPLLPYAKTYPFKKGDLYFMPWNKYHIGYSDELSVGVTLWFDNHGRRALLNKLIESIKIQYIDMNDTTITLPEKEVTDLSGFFHVEAILSLEDRLATIPFTDLLKEVYLEYKLALYSNGGWIERPLSLSEEVGYDENNYGHFAGKFIKAIYPYKLYYRVIDEDQLFIFARGSKIEIKYHLELTRILDKLNSFEIFFVDELVKELSLSWPEEAGYYFLSLLYNTRGIELVNKQS